MAVSQNTIDAIKRQPLSQVIEASGARLKRVGHEYLTQCPWHKDTNPSLTINDEKGFCFCHVCRGGGDAVDYVQRRKGLPWRDAVEFAASVVGVSVEVEEEDQEALARRKAALASARARLEKDQARYYSNLRGEKAGRIRQILKDRGMNKEAANEFGLGFAPSGEFEMRITVPIYDHMGRLVGFTGRTTKDHPAKYKNSADSDIFQKKQLVFNEHRAKEAARETGCFVFVEGHLDVVSMWQAGIKNVVAMQGTGAPDPQILERMARTAKTFILCYDGDAGGAKATEQFISAAGKLAQQGKISINVVSLPEGQDPDEFLREGGDLYHRIANAPSWLDWLIDVWAAGLDHEDTQQVIHVERLMRDLINGLQSQALRAHYIDRASRVLGQSGKEAESIAKEWNTIQIEVDHRQWHRRPLPEARKMAEIRLLRMYIHSPELREQLKPLLTNIQHPPLLWLVKRLEELETHCSVDLTPYSVAAIVCVAEPHYMAQLRSLVQPKVHIDKSPGVIEHLSGILADIVDFIPDEPNTHQPSA